MKAGEAIDPGAAPDAAPGTGTSSGAARGNRALLGLLALQSALALVFLGFFVIDVLPVRQRPFGYTLREAVQIAAVLALFLSVAINVVLLRRILARNRALEQSLMVARGAFETLAEAEFDRWALSAAEREIAILALKGFSNAEIAAMTGKSEGTVKSQTAAVFRKAGVQGRIGLVGHFMDELVADSLLDRVRGGPDSRKPGARTP